MTQSEPIRIGINGLGRIGRAVLRQALVNPAFDVVAVNAPGLDAEYISYTLRYDSVHGRSQAEITANADGNLEVSMGGRRHKIVVFDERDPALLQWGRAGAEYIVESTGRFTTLDTAAAHVVGGARKVIITAPSKDAPMYVYGVNHDQYRSEQTVVSNASCTTNCLAPLALALNRAYGIEEALMTTVHSLTNSQTILDAHSKRDWRAGRSGTDNIIPASTGAAKALGKVIPELSGKVTGMSMRVPTSNVSLVDLTVRLERPIPHDFTQSLREAVRVLDPAVISCTDEPLVSQDLCGTTLSCTVDLSATLVLNERFIKVLGWYDNEWGYSARVLDMVHHMYQVDSKAATK